MWHARRDTGQNIVTCTACGTDVPRSGAREYDKEGNRWERHDKSFEHFCKDCFRELCHQPRGDLEALLTEIEDEDGGGGLSRAEFLSRYIESVEAETPRDERES